ncbi:MAG: hypothetical protein U5L45_16380 [Saprospiraceae bacterium]|nr:hypothetical protein [Saprospiraceae bacterium]
MPRQHYTLQRSQLIKRGLQLVERERYFTIWAPRQTGKSTYFQLLSERLKEEGYLVTHVNFENYKEATMKAFLNEFHFKIIEGWGIDFTGKDLQETNTPYIQI